MPLGAAVRDEREAGEQVADTCWASPRDLASGLLPLLPEPKRGGRPGGLGLELHLEQQNSGPARSLSPRSCQDSLRHGGPWASEKLQGSQPLPWAPVTSSSLRQPQSCERAPRCPDPEGAWKGRPGLAPHLCRRGSGRLSVSCRLPGATSLAGAGPTAGGPGGRRPRSQPVAHHGHLAHPLPTESLLQHSADRDKCAGPSRQQRGPPVLSRSQPGTQGGGWRSFWEAQLDVRAQRCSETARPPPHTGRAGTIN
ncbi:translation initiation factor IF-2-like [Felis catus]|uniref:translation initiation factor IF-2-like n=1 Tax=Felis catus TaxID=9685 RepID=UPI001D1A2CFF|nr:translation initiation factor IF-2-like [Felis catus]